MLGALAVASFGQKTKVAKPMKHLGSGVMEIALPYSSEAYRVVYAVQVGDAICSRPYRDCRWRAATIGSIRDKLVRAAEPRKALFKPPECRLRIIRRARRDTTLGGAAARRRELAAANFCSFAHLKPSFSRVVGMVTESCHFRYGFLAIAD